MHQTEETTGISLFFIICANFVFLSAAAIQIETLINEVKQNLGSIHFFNQLNHRY